MRFDKICNINWDFIFVISYLSMLRFLNTCHRDYLDELFWTFQLTRRSVTWRGIRWVSPSLCPENPGPEKPSPPSTSWSISPSPGALTSTSSSRGYSSVSCLQDYYYTSTRTGLASVFLCWKKEPSFLIFGVKFKKCMLYCIKSIKFELYKYMYYKYWLS